MKQKPKKFNPIVLKVLAFVMGQKERGSTPFECRHALKMPEAHATVSARFNELVQSGCFIETKERRRNTTKSNPNATATSIVYVHREGYGYGHYQHYMRTKQRRTRKVHGITPFEQQVLDVGMHFIKSLAGKGKVARQRLLVEHVQKLSKLSQQYQQEASKAKDAPPKFRVASIR